MKMKKNYDETVIPETFSRIKKKQKQANNRKYVLKKFINSYYTQSNMYIKKKEGEEEKGEGKVRMTLSLNK